MQSSDVSQHETTICRLYRQPYPAHNNANNTNHPHSTHSNGHPQDAVLDNLPQQPLSLASTPDPSQPTANGNTTPQCTTPMEATPISMQLMMATMTPHPEPCITTAGDPAISWAMDIHTQPTYHSTATTIHWTHDTFSPVFQAIDCLAAAIDDLSASITATFPRTTNVLDHPKH